MNASNASNLSTDRPIFSLWFAGMFFFYFYSIYKKKCLDD